MALKNCLREIKIFCDFRISNDVYLYYLNNEYLPNVQIDDKAVFLLFRNVLSVSAYIINQFPKTITIESRETFYPKTKKHLPGLLTLFLTFMFYCIKRPYKKNKINCFNLSHCHKTIFISRILLSYVLFNFIKSFFKILIFYKFLDQKNIKYHSEIKKIFHISFGHVTIQLISLMLKSPDLAKMFFTIDPLIKIYNPFVQK